MRRAKKYLSILLALCMIASLTVNAFASETGTETPESAAAVMEEASEQLSSEADTTVASEKETSAEELLTEQSLTEGSAESEAESEGIADEESAEENEKETIAAEQSLMETPAAADVEAVSTARDTSGDGFYKIVHLDAGRKYFSPDNIKAIIDNAAAAGFNQVELYLSDNQGFRFALNDMTITTSYDTYDLTPALGDGYSDGYSDGSKYPDGSGKYLTQTEMSGIISYAKEKGIEIVPCINVPGHMGAILEAFPGFRYSSSKSSINLENDEAVAFALALTEKYAAYFADQGVKFYNLGADEYANDMSTMGFQGLYTSGEYQRFVDFLNNAAQIVINHGMTPRAFNDGIYYNNDTNYDINKNIQVCYWSSGWGGYNVASAGTIAAQGHDLINTHGDYYWVLGNSGWQCSSEKAGQFDIASFQGSTISSPAGAMFCIWCDNGAADGQDDGANVVTKTADVISAFGAALPGNTAEESTVTCKNGIIFVTAPGLTSLVCEEADAPQIKEAKEGRIKAYNITPYVGETAYTESASVSISIPTEWDAQKVRGFVVNSDGTITTNIAGKAENGSFTFTAPHFSVMGIYEALTEVTEEKIITLTVGGTVTETLKGADYTGNIDRTELNETIADVTATYETIPGGNGNPEKADSLTNGQSYIIGDGNGNYLKLNGTTLSNTTDVAEATEWTATSSGSSWTLSYEEYYLNHADNTLSLGNENNTWNYSNTNGFSYTVYGDYVTFYLTSDSNWSCKYSLYTSNRGFAYTVTSTEEVQATTVAFNGLSAGTTYVTIGSTRYTINVIAEDLSKVEPLNVEYWITNSKVYEISGDTGSPSSMNISAQQAYGEAGVEIADLVPETAYSNYDGWLELHFWQAMRLDSNNHQTGDSGDDETADGTSFTKVRYYNSSWQYMAADSSWHSFVNGDQAVAYYMRHTEITKEITTAMKDWGYETSGTTPNTSSGKGQVALTVAVVYPDGTVSPTESSMYANSTTIFNYWSGRDIGIIAPLSNEDYDISKITVTDGMRVGNSSQNVWYSSNSITWEKTTNAAGTQWYDEEEIWNDTMGTEPVVNGRTSNITWSAKNTAKLVLIYLKPVQKDTNLTVNWVDDSANAFLIHTSQIVVSGETTTFLNGLVQSSAVQAGSFTLDDNAYITNSSNVNQTINKDITVIPGVAGQYTSGLYEYVGAEISQDGKTMTLHYSLSSASLSKEYVVDFGLPVNVPLTDLMENISSVKNVIVSSNASYNSTTKTIRYTPENILNGIETVSARVEYTTGEPTTFAIGFVPATTVYYEEGFATYTGFTGGSKGSIAQTKEAVETKINNYGYDPAYDDVQASNGTQATSTAYGDKATFSFTGTGVGIYANCDTQTGKLFIWVKNSATSKIVQVQTALLNGEKDFTQGQDVTGYNVPVAVIEGLPHASYEVTISHVRPNSEQETDTVNLDGFRVYGTLKNNNHEVYQKDGEANPTFVELRDKVLAAVGVNEINDSKYADQIASDVLAQVYSSTGGTNGAIVISDENTYGAGNAQDLLENGPKNELYLRKGESVVFSLNENYSAQIGLKALNAAVSYTMNEQSKTLNTSTDMFYSLETGTCTITNNSDNGAILSITELKLFGDGTSAEPALLSLEEADLVPAIMSLRSSGTTEPVEPEEPEITYADASLQVSVVDYSGKEIAAASLSANGAEGEEAVFTADDIAAAAAGALPAGYGLDESSAMSDASVKYGETDTVVVRAGKVATLVVTYKKLLGKTMGTVTLTKVQTSSDAKAVFKAAEIKAAVPDGCRLLSVIVTSEKVTYGYSSGKTVYVYE